MSAPASAAETEDERALRRVVERLSRPGAWLRAVAGGYQVVQGADRRRRPALRLEAEAFAALAKAPGLVARTGEGWILAARPRGPVVAPPPPGRPGQLLEERPAPDASGATAPRMVNLTAGALGWLRARRDPAGRPWLSPRRIAAADRLERDHELSGSLGRLTMGWEAGPKSPSATGFGLNAGERASAARSRRDAALTVLGTADRALVRRLVLEGWSLAEAERTLGLGRRNGRPRLLAALDRLADHYRIG